MKKFFLSSALIVAFAIYIIFQKAESESLYIAPAPARSNRKTVFQAPPSKPVGLFKDGSYIGDVADAYYGNIEVKAIIQNGKIQDVRFLQYPNDRRNSIRINTEAMPLLKSEAIRAQSAEVDIISGATQTSGAFIESLTSALAQARLPAGQAKN